MPLRVEAVEATVGSAVGWEEGMKAASSAFPTPSSGSLAKEEEEVPGVVAAAAVRVGRWGWDSASASEAS